MFNSGNNASRGSNTLASPDVPPLPQCLPLEPITLGNQKYTRSGELRRVLGVPLGSISEDHCFGVGQSKPTPPVATEELKNFKDSVQDASRKARDRAKILRDSIFKLEKYEVLSSKKRQRADVSSDRSSEANLLKMGNQIFRRPHDQTTQKLEDKSKAEPGLKKRIRTSMLDGRGDGRPAGVPRQQIALEKDRDMLKVGVVGAIQIEERIRRLRTGGEGWDKKMKRKRSVGAIGNRAMSGQLDMKRIMHPKSSADTKFRSIDAHGFRSRSSPAMSGVNSSEEFFEPDNSNSCTVVKNEQQSVSSLRDRTAILEEKTIAKGSNKLNIHEENLAGSPSNIIKGKVSRTSRTDCITMIDSSIIHPSPGTPRGWEQPVQGNKVLPLGVANNHKRPVSAGASAHQMAQWVGRRPHKISRTGRANLVSPVSNIDETNISSQGLACEFSARIPPRGTGGSPLATSVDNNNSKFKLKVENTPSPLGLSEGDESGGGEKRLDEKGANAVELAENGDHKARDTMWPSRKNKILGREETGDGKQGQGRSGRFLSSTRSALTPVAKKVESLPTTNALQSTRHCLDKNKSKSGRPPSKKMTDRKVSIRAGHVLNGSSSDFTGESDDDHEELLIAANSARNASNLACSGPFWKKVEHLFASVTPEDASYLRQQLNVAEELNESLSQMFSDEYNDLGVLMHEVPINSDGRQDRDNSFDTVPPLYQRVLSALIEEDGSEELCHQSERRNMSFQCTSEDSHCGSCNHNGTEPRDRDRMESEVESEMDIFTQKHCLLDRFSCNRSASSNTNSNRSVSSSLCNNEQWQADDGLSYSDSGFVPGICQSDLGLPHSLQVSVSAVSSFDCQYQMLSLDDKLLLELQSIGLYPETMPTLAEGEEKINQDIMQLQAGLCQQVGKMKNNLGRISKAIEYGRDLERRNREQDSMNQLLEMAYRRRMACRRSHSSKSVVRRVSKHVALAFVKRTLARCQKFEDTGRSCFSDPALQDVILTEAPSDNHAKSVDSASPKTASNRYSEAHVHKTEPRVSGSQLSINHSSEQAFFKDEPKLNKGKKRELLLDDVIGSASSKATSAGDGTQLGGVKAKRSEREKDQNRDMLTGKSSGPSLGCFRSDQKSKPKPRQKASLLPTSGSGLQGRHMDATNHAGQSACGSNPSMGLIREQGLPSPGDIPQDLSQKEVESVDFANMLAGNQDLSSWLNFDDEGLQDHDCIGLDIPMDDLSEVI